ILWIDAPAEITEVDRIIRGKHVYTVETCAQAWRTRLWLNVVKYFIEHPKARKVLPAKLRDIYANLAEPASPANIAPLKISDVPRMVSQVRANRATLIDETAAAIVAAKMNVLFLIDTIEEYRIREEAIENTISGLFYLAGINNPRTSGCKL